MEKERGTKELQGMAAILAVLARDMKERPLATRLLVHFNLTVDDLNAAGATESDVKALRNIIKGD